MLQPVAVRVTFSGLQILVLLAEIIGATALQVPQSVLDVMTMLLEAPLVPQPFIQVAAYVPAVFTVNIVPVLPPVQTIVPLQPLAVKIAVSLGQILVLFAAMIGAVGVLPCVIVIIVEAPLVPQAVVQIALNVPAVPTVMLVPVEPLLQVTVPPHPVAVSVAVSVPQILVLLLTTVGAPGVPPVVIMIGFEAPLTPQRLVQVAV